MMVKVFFLKRKKPMAEKKPYEELLEYIVKALCDHPQDAKITKTVDEMGVLLSLKVHPEDMGQIIGKKGMTVQAIRQLIRIAGLKNRARVTLRVEEPDKK